MSIYYHGTNSKREILEGGFKILEKNINGKHFGKALYFTPSEKNAYIYGDEVITVEIDDEFLLDINSMDEFNRIEYTSLFWGGMKNWLKDRGYRGFKLKQIDGNYVIVIFDESVINIVL